MKTMLKKTLSWVLVLATLFTLTATMTIGASAAVLNLGKAGEYITASYNEETKTLTLTGSGTMQNYLADGSDDLVSGMTSRPWESYVGKIEKVVVGNGITTIGNAAFYGLTACTSYTFSTSLTTIGEWALANNNSLRSVVLPASLQRVRKFAFFGTPLTADNLKNSIAYGSPTIEAGKAVNTYLINDLNPQYSTGVNYEASGVVTQEDGRTPSGIEWKYTSKNKTLTLTNVGTVAVPLPGISGNGPWSDFNNEIATIVVGNNITAIGKNAFQGLTAVTSVQLGQNVAAIREFAFAGCSALKQLQLPAATLTVEQGAFGSRETGNTITVSTPNSEYYMTTSGVISQVGNSLVVWSFGTYTPPTTPSNPSNPSQPTTPSSDKNGLVNTQIRWDYSAASKTLQVSLVSGVTAAVIPDYTSYATTPWAQAGLTNAISNVVIGPGITAIGDYAFAYLPYLTYVGIGSSVQSIGAYAFVNNAALTMISFPASVALVEGNAFAGCSALYFAQKLNQNMTVQLPNTELINALNYATGGSTPSVPSTPTTPGGSGANVDNTIPGTMLTWSYNTATRALNIRGAGAIPNYTSAAATPWAAYAPNITAITVQSGVTGIGNYAFSGLSAAVDLYLPNTVTSIGAYAFSNCTSLKSFELPAGVETINEYTFFNCTALETVTLPSNLKQIGKGAFYGCTGLKFVDFPTLLQIIGERAFYNCSTLGGVIFRSSNLYIGSEAFYGCTALTKAVCFGTQPMAATGNELLVARYVTRFGTGTNGNVSWDIDRVTGVLTVTGNGDVTNSTGWKDELQFAETVVFNGVTTIGANLLKDNTNVKNVVLPDTVQIVGVSAFENCTNLKSVTFSQNLTTMGARAFYGCSKLTSVVLPDSLIMVPDEAFAACTALSSVKLGNRTVAIGARAFASCIALPEIELPATLTTLGTGAFADCYTLSKLTLSTGAMMALPNGVFTGCSSLRSVYFNGNQTQWMALSSNADTVIKSAVVTYCTTVTIYYEYEGGPLNGQAVKEAETFTGAMGTTQTVTLPVVEHYASDAATMNITFGTTNTSYYVKYKPKTYTVTIRFVDDVTGVDVAENKVYQIQYLGSLTTPSFNLTGYTLQENPIVINNVTGNVSKTVKCTKKTYNYAVEYVNERTGKVFYTETGSAKYGEKAVHTPKAMEGYTVKSGDYSIAAVTGGDHKITVTYTPNKYTLTIHYVDKDGTQISDDVSKEFYYGDEVKVDSPVVTGKTPDKAAVIFERYAGEERVTVTYDWTYYTVTVHFTEKDSIGYAVHKDFTTQVKHGDSFIFRLSDHSEYATPAAYVTDTTVLDFGTVTQNAEKTITYSRKNLTLTVNYTDAKGNVLDTELLTVPAGTTYTVAAKEVEGYLTSEEFTHQMGTEDETLTVQLEIDPDAPVKGGNAVKIILVIVVILLVLVTGGALFYFLYLKKKPQW